MSTILGALGAIVYLAIGVCIALWFFNEDRESETRWWQIVAVVVLWPLIPIGLVVMVVAWMAGGSH